MLFLLITHDLSHEDKILIRAKNKKDLLKQVRNLFKSTEGTFNGSLITLKGLEETDLEAMDKVFQAIETSQQREDFYNGPILTKFNSNKTITFEVSLINSLKKMEELVSEGKFLTPFHRETN